MNFLAHQHLSYPNSKEMVGNFIGDYVKGKQYNDYESAIAKGIILHRRIDNFTDHHPISKQCRQLFAPSYGKYAGIIVDMVYDHALATNWSTFSHLSLDDFSHVVYRIMDANFDILPQRVQYFLPKMKQAKRLQSYASKEGILYAIDLMTQYTSLPDCGDATRQVLERNYDSIIAYFNSFYADIQNYVIDERERLELV